MNTNVNFEIAKLLKEKGFNKRSEPSRYNNYGELSMLEGINAPTIAEVIMWLYEKHGIWICVRQDYDNGKFEEFLTHKPKLHDTPTEAYEAAILYVLKIK